MPRRGQAGPPRRTSARRSATRPPPRGRPARAAAGPGTARTEGLAQGALGRADAPARPSRAPAGSMAAARGRVEERMSNGGSAATTAAARPVPVRARPAARGPGPPPGPARRDTGRHGIGITAVRRGWPGEHRGGRDVAALPRYDRDRHVVTLELPRPGRVCLRSPETRHASCRRCWSSCPCLAPVQHLFQRG